MMLDTNAQQLLSEALKLPHPQRTELVDALLESMPAGEAVEHFPDAPPLTPERLAQLSDEGRQALASGDYQSFESPQALAQHVGELFDRAREEKDRT